MMYSGQTRWQTAILIAAPAARRPEDEVPEDRPGQPRVEGQASVQPQSEPEHARQHPRRVGVEQRALVELASDPSIEARLPPVAFVKAGDELFQERRHLRGREAGRGRASGQQVEEAGHGVVAADQPFQVRSAHAIGFSDGLARKAPRDAVLVHGDRHQHVGEVLRREPIDQPGHEGIVVQVHVIVRIAADGKRRGPSEHDRRVGHGTPIERGPPDPGRAGGTAEPPSQTTSGRPHDGDIRPGPQKRHLTCEALRVVHVVGVGASHQLGVGQLQRGPHGGRHPLVGSSDDPQSTIGAGAQESGALVGRAIVDGQQGEVGVRLAEHALEGRAQIGRRVVDRHDHRHRRRVDPTWGAPTWPPTPPERSAAPRQSRGAPRG